MGAVPVALAALQAASASSAPFIIGANAKFVADVIQAAERRDDASFGKRVAQSKFFMKLSKANKPPTMATLDLRPNCRLARVVGDSELTVTATWNCKAGKIDTTTERTFVVEAGKVVLVTGPAEPALKATR